MPPPHLRTTRRHRHNKNDDDDGGHKKHPPPPQPRGPDGKFCKKEKPYLYYVRRPTAAVSIVPYLTRSHYDIITINVADYIDAIRLEADNPYGMVITGGASIPIITTIEYYTAFQIMNKFILYGDYGILTSHVAEIIKHEEMPRYKNIKKENSKEMDKYRRVICSLIISIGELKAGGTNAEVAQYAGYLQSLNHHYNLISEFPLSKAQIIAALQ